MGLLSFDGRKTGKRLHSPWVSFISVSGQNNFQGVHSVLEEKKVTEEVEVLISAKLLASTSRDEVERVIPSHTGKSEV